MLAREILRMRGTIARSVPWEIKVDLFFYRDPEEARVSFCPNTHAIHSPQPWMCHPPAPWGHRGPRLFLGR